ncbi:dTDP-4-dehydrorhamnose reductase [Pedobacter psychrotolerans]|uniref:dTDP-4-dehydrorhamnose reductase n=1 Tax=Pedobacter psychrotolerans TaxID=1843235 RepID=A0A4R2HM50_9SPHI|nr:SDR family oxidoreductase [Pedobacter psychrotolerans]TCO30682.1 dTDP-4-dehydrorhamnose reductase [Pedobacter psychrotolerans]GGE68318.1 NAD(P)-dependent oxidoreductase [Pedobacter psychrotolerans]
MKTILVTGSNGLLGQKITEKVLAEGSVKLIATSKGPNRYPIVDDYKYIEMDILDYALVKEVISTHRPDAIVHTAAMTNVDTSEENKELCYALNVKATQNLVSLCEEYQIHFIHLSTDFIFDGIYGPYAEEDAPNPLSYYGETKLLAELAVKESKANWVILRTILVYGITKDMSRSNIVLWAKGALEKGLPINAVNDQWRMPTLAEDLADACLLAVQNNAQGVYHISGKDDMSIVEIVRKVADYWLLDKALISEISSENLKQNAKRPARTGFILDKAMKDLKYHPHSFEVGLKILDEQMKKNN